jgi:biotin synthase
MPDAVLAIDQGTTGSTALVLDRDGRVLGRATEEFTQHYPQPGWVEHDPEEIVDLMLLARRFGATYSGIMRRINFPGSPFSRHGMITELEMARMVAVSRLVMGAVPKAHCTHEPHSASLMAGANLFFPEVGASPRDGEADTGKGRGRDFQRCRAIQKEMGLDPDKPSNCFT